MDCSRFRCKKTEQTQISLPNIRFETLKVNATAACIEAQRLYLLLITHLYHLHFHKRSAYRNSFYEIKVMFLFEILSRFCIQNVGW